MRPYVVSIAGVDPCAGAGLLADIKTFEQLQVYGLGVCSSLTHQTDRHFAGLKWVSTEDILENLALQFDRFEIKGIKIGLVQDWEALLQVLHFLRGALDYSGPIVWDPVLRASTGFDFNNHQPEVLDAVLEKVNLVTPNLPEFRQLTGTSVVEEGVRKLGFDAGILLKGGHAEEKARVEDTLFFNKKLLARYSNKRVENEGKHGSGCVLSSAILANLAKGKPLEEACANGIAYTQKLLKSNDGLLGYHHA